MIALLLAFTFTISPNDTPDEQTLAIRRVVGRGQCVTIRFFEGTERKHQLPNRAGERVLGQLALGEVMVMEFVWTVLLCVALEGSTCDPYKDGVGSVIVFATQASCEKAIKNFPAEFVGEYSGKNMHRVWQCYKTELRK